MRRFACCALLLAAACGSDAALSGSLSEAFDLSFNTIEIRRSPEAVQVSYLRSEGREVVARITVATAGIELGKSVSLGGEWAPGHPRTTVTRAVDGEPVRSLPPVASGELTFDRVPDVGATVTGDFTLAFGQGGEVGAGRTLEGEFNGEVFPAL